MSYKEAFQPAFSDVVAVKDLFNSAGWAKFEEHVKLLVEQEQNRIDRLTDGKYSLSEKDLFQLNIHATRKGVLKDLLSIKETMLDEVDPDRENLEDNKGFAVGKAE